MTERFGDAASAQGAPARVLTAIDIAVAVMLDTPAVSRAVMGTLGAPEETPGEVSQRSRALWAIALGDGDGLDSGSADLALAILPDQLAAAFRGVLSFWSTGEINNAALRIRAQKAAATLLLGFA